MTCELGDRWTCGRCGRVEFAKRKNEKREERPPGWRKMSFRVHPQLMESSGSVLAPDPTVKDLCGPCVKILSDVWDGGEPRTEIRKETDRYIPPDAS